MCEVIQRVNAPLAASAMVIGMANAINDRVAHHNIRMRHVNLQAKNMFPIFKFAITHLTKQLQILFGAAITIRTVFANLAKVTAIGVNIFSALAVNIGFAILNQNFCKLIEFVKVITGVIQMGAPIKTEPLHRIQNTICVFHIFFDGISVI